ncbi:PH domain-containing protein [Nonomuraea sp. NBC_00507]|uniref:PH domain-containing protein n=1 Tax=Nonomuraea sp. NBC_00507 TaxID=2976002 RepID=UPI002E196176
MSEISVRREQDASRSQDWQRLARRSLGASAVKSSVFVVPAVLGLVRFLTTRDWPVAGVVAVCAGAAVLIVAGVLAYDLIRLRTTRWRLTGDRLELRSGIAVRQRRSIPRDRVRSVDLRADPVLRAFGLTVVKVGTGERSAGDDELRLDPLTRHDAETLRRALLPGAVAGPQADAPLAELKWSWITYAPLSVWTFTGAAVVLGLAYKGLDTIGVKVLTTEVAAGLWSWVTARPLVTVPLLVVANAAVGVLGAVLLFAESWGRYRLEREPGRLRLRRGLLTARSLTMEERRLRGVEISEPLLLRLGGGARVKAIATGLGKAGENETEDVAALTPPLPRAVAGHLAAEIARTNLPAPAGLAAHPRAARRRRIRRALVTVLVLAAVAAAVSSLVPWAWVRAWVWAAPAVALPLGLWLAAESARSLGHALAGRHLITRTGAVVRRTVALDRAGISGWTITESLFQRRHGLLTVSATTAAGDGRYDVVDVGRGDGLDLASCAVPGLLEPFLDRSARNT